MASRDRDTDFPIVVYTDGASSGNPGPGGWAAIVATPDGEVAELGGRVLETTNNAMELTAAAEALRAIEDSPGRVEIYTDSTYLIRGITQWIFAWAKRGWTTAEGEPLANLEIWKDLAGLVRRRREAWGAPGWNYVRGHRGTPGNERVDRLAVAFSQGKRPRLYRGRLVSYDVAVHDLPEPEPLPERPKGETRKTAKAAPHSYLSLVDGRIVRHKDWVRCESRVKGRSGAKFQKAMTPEEETGIVERWGRRASEIAEDT